MSSQSTAPAPETWNVASAAPAASMAKKRATSPESLCT